MGYKKVSNKDDESNKVNKNSKNSFITYIFFKKNLSEDLLVCRTGKKYSYGIKSVTTALIKPDNCNGDIFN